MLSSHFPAAMITGHEALIPSMTTAASDRHVLAAAVAGHADAVVTENVKNFPAEATAPYGITVVHQDAFLLDRDESTVRRAMTRQVSRYRR